MQGKSEKIAFMTKTSISRDREHQSIVYLVLIPWVFSAVSPLRRAKDEGFRSAFAILIMPWHCSIVAKLGKYNARGNQLKTYPKDWKCQMRYTYTN